MATLNEVAEVTEGEAPATAEEGDAEADAEADAGEGSGEGDESESEAAASEEGGSGEVRLALCSQSTLKVTFWPCRGTGSIASAICSCVLPSYLYINLEVDRFRGGI